MEIITFLILILFRENFALIGYDCGSINTNITTISLLNVGECEVKDDNVNVTQRYIQLLQINDYSDTHIIQCKLEVRRTIRHCGMHSHNSIVSNGENEYIQDISRETCITLHKTGTMIYGINHVLQGVKVNNTKTFSMTFAGWLNSDGKCNGAVYTDPFGTWEEVIVTGTLRVTLTDYTAQVALNSNNLRLRSGTVCSLSDTSCIDMEGGYTFWNTIPTDSCKFNRYGVLYEGMANKLVDTNTKIEEQIIYSLTADDITFALAAKGVESVCGYTIIKTEHPKLLIYELKKGEGFAVQNTLSVSNLDIFAYVNSKFVYVEKYIRTQIKEMYLDILRQKCDLEKQTIKNSLSIATRSPDEFAYDFMKGPGYMAVIAGEVVHIIKCIPVEVKIQEGEICYAELQVTRNNKTYFITPRTHILKGQGTQIPCNKALASYYSTGKIWYKVLPAVTDAIPPQIIKPMSKLTWEYRSPVTLATDGIYSAKELNSLRERIMYPMERPSLLNDIARELRGQPVAGDTTLSKLLSDNAVDRIVVGAWDKLWSRFLTFGTVSAGVIAVLMIIHLIKSAIDIALQGYALHTVYGWSIHLVGALWSSVTQLLLHLGKPENSQQPDIEMSRSHSTTSIQRNDVHVYPELPNHIKKEPIANERNDYK